MNISKVAKATGISAKMIRYYEQSGLIPPALRTGSGYRHYSERDVHMLSFIRRARDLGFSVRSISSLLGLWTDQTRKSADVRKLALEHLENLRQKIHELESMSETLEGLIESCSGNHRPDCPILADLAGSGCCDECGPPEHRKGAVEIGGLHSGR